MNRYIHLYFSFLTQYLKVLMEYRINFVVGALSSVFPHIASLMFIWVVMQHVSMLQGWSMDGIFLIYGLVTLSRSLCHMFAENLWTLGRDYIRTGNFDRFLVRPINPLFQLLADRFCHEGIGTFIVGLLLIIRATTSLDIIWNIHKIILLIITVLSGGIIFTSINLMTSISAFWVVDSIPIVRSVWQTHEFAKFPFSIYSKEIVFLMTWAIPYGFTSFYPASYIIGHDVGVLAWLSPVVALALTIISYRLWKWGLYHYTSTGS